MSNTVEVLRVKFHWPAKIFEFSNPNSLVLKRFDSVVVKTNDGYNKVGTVAVPPRIRAKRAEDQYMESVLRLADDRDISLEKVTEEFKRDVKNFFATRVASTQVSGVKLVDCEKADAGKRLIVYYQSENKHFDYKGMAIEISRKFGVRVDMRPVGIRDSARLAGGIGKCGLSLCCSTWLTKFQPVSIKMAKDQGLSPEPDGITGQCGRLLCCLGYEHQNYLEAGKTMPKSGKMVITPDGEGRVVKLDILKQMVSVRMVDGGDVIRYEAEKVKRKFAPNAQQAPGNKKKNSKNKKKARPATKKEGHRDSKKTAQKKTDS